MTKVGLTITSREDLAPKCPFCQMELGEIYCKSKGLGLLQGKNVVYFCPHCRKILGIGQSRMV